MGYNLRVELHEEVYKKKIIKIVNQHIGNCKRVELGSEIRFLLPYEQIKQFSSLFRDLEGKFD